MEQQIIIAGMHRSGTSLSASLLQKSGLFIGSDLMSGRFDNEKGHFEDLRILEIHENDLAMKGLNTTGMGQGIHDSLAFESITETKIERFLNELPDLKLWGWKEPRTTLYLEAWKGVLPNAKYIALYRHYDEVAMSLIRRYKYKLRYGIGMTKFTRLKHFIIYPINILIKRRQAYKAWVVYNKAILNCHNKFPEDTIIFNLNNFTDNYNTALQEINKAFNIHLKDIDVDQILNKKLLNATKKQGLRLRLFSKQDLEGVLNDLNKKTKWM
ncbi:sulfotransferase [Winogradskyella flava]|uniref:Sulfotransferase n=1 Tax=Winogradskyella flava TaxID=1884876 RepID=A0A842INY3_9FLAO|nr:sulfotransferase [Winogradskyella flava]MBC2844491.1 sulfotransferase [Winogradskyella flava]